jgi:Sulfotransferase domain
MKVIGAGFGRTGTMSLKAALEQLGSGPCYHMVDLIARPEQAPAWRDAANGGPRDWDSLLAGYEATVDWPGCTFYRELLDSCPDAKVLLTVRDPDAWYESTLNTLHAVRDAMRNGRIASADAELAAPDAVLDVIDRIIWEGTFGGRFHDRAHAVEVFNAHNEQVRETVPADRLVVHEIKDGWEPLARLLEVDVPDAPFPRLNDTAAFRSMVGLRALQRT